MIPVVWLSVKTTGVPVPQLVYGKVLEKVTGEGSRADQGPEGDPGPRHLQGTRRRRRGQAEGRRQGVRRRQGGAGPRRSPRRKPTTRRRRRRRGRQEGRWRRIPKDAAAAKARVDQGRGCSRHARHRRSGTPRRSPARTRRRATSSRRNFLALVFCLMVGTAALPHILMRYYTTPSVREARKSVFWSLFFIFLLYFTAPALAVLVKYDVYTLPGGVGFREAATVGGVVAEGRSKRCCRSSTSTGTASCSWRRSRSAATSSCWPRRRSPGLPYVISGLVAAGGLAAALSTADGLLLTIANALSHDFYYKMLDPNASTDPPGDDLQDAAAGRRVGRGLGRVAETGGHPVPGVGGVLVRGGGVLPGAGAGHLLEAREQVGRHAGHAGRRRDHVLLHGHDPAVDARRLWRHESRSPTTSGGASSRSRPDCGAYRSGSWSSSWSAC